MNEVTNGQSVSPTNNNSSETETQERLEKLFNDKLADLGRLSLQRSLLAFNEQISELAE